LTADEILNLLELEPNATGGFVRLPSSAPNRSRPEFCRRRLRPRAPWVRPLSEARRVCASMGAPADACAWVVHGACHLVVPARNRAAYRRHEMAHCNGWDHR